jgi:hypothetical protein
VWRKASAKREQLNTKLIELAQLWARGRLSRREWNAARSTLHEQLAHCQDVLAKTAWRRRWGSMSDGRTGCLRRGTNWIRSEGRRFCGLSYKMSPYGRRLPPCRTRLRSGCRYGGVLSRNLDDSERGTLSVQLLKGDQRAVTSCAAFRSAHVRARRAASAVFTISVSKGTALQGRWPFAESRLTEVCSAWRPVVKGQLIR